MVITGSAASSNFCQRRRKNVLRRRRRLPPTSAIAGALAGSRLNVQVAEVNDLTNEDAIRAFASLPPLWASIH